MCTPKMPKFSAPPPVFLPPQIERSPEIKEEAHKEVMKNPEDTIKKAKKSGTQNMQIPLKGKDKSGLNY